MFGYGTGEYTFFAAYVFIALVYFLPTTVAIARRHHNITAIILTNALLGWTFVGWVVVLIWSFASNDWIRLSKRGSLS